MDKNTVLLLALLVLLISSSIALSTEYWGSKSPNKYHNPICKWAQNINSPNHLVKFNLPEDSRESCYMLCKICMPLISSRSDMTDAQIAGTKVKDFQEPQRRGCCSHHGGVCGCKYGRALCCDGELSPTCGCD
jgi:hypothetical protein